MKKKIKLLSTLIVAISTLSATAATKPNIVFILADDLGYQDVGFNGSKWFETPHLDALAKESTVFEYASMYPTCSPSRTALLTGRHSFRTQVYSVPVLEKGSAKDNLFSRWTVEEKHPFYSKPLNEAGYKLIHLGKWHVVGPYPEREKNYPFKSKLKQPKSGDMAWVGKHKSEYLSRYYPKAKGFHENVGGTFWGDPARGYKQGYNAVNGGYRAPYFNPFIEERKKGEWLTDRLTDDAIAFIEKHKGEPFFVNLHYYSPHRPSIAVTPEALAKFKQKPEDKATGQTAKNHKEMAAYGTMVENLDQNVGRIVSYLDDAGLRENTVLIFTSDNGYNIGYTKQLRGNKGTCYEGGLRVPAFVHWKGKTKGARVKTNITVLDYFPTFLEIAGVEDYSELLDGHSFWKLAVQEAEVADEQAHFWHIASNYKTPACSIMKKGPWKLIQFLKKGNIELYHLEDDPKESKNLAETNKQVADEMVSALSEWRKKNTVPLPPSSSL